MSLPRQRGHRKPTSADEPLIINKWLVPGLVLNIDGEWLIYLGRTPDNALRFRGLDDCRECIRRYALVEDERYTVTNVGGSGDPASAVAQS